jgi:CBS domain containing-hemolysin-like protein
MESIRVKDLMVPKEEYVVIDEDSTLFEAVIRLDEERAKHELGRCPHRAILVCDKQGRVLGKLNQIDVLRSLESKYNEIGDLKKVSGFGLSASFLKAVMDKFELWEAPLDDLCRKGAALRVGDLVSSPLEGEMIDIEASLNRAAHQLVVGHHQSLLVTSKGDIVGILKLSDVFRTIVERMRACGI